jgi:hypothetical protein
MDDNAWLALILIFLIIFVPNFISASKNDKRREEARKRYYYDD